MGKEKRIAIRLCDRTMMIIDELTEHANVTESAFIRYIIDRTLDKLIDKEGYIDENKTRGFEQRDNDEDRKPIS